MQSSNHGKNVNETLINIPMFINQISSLDLWAKQNEKGEQCLSRQVLGKPSSELQDVSNECMIKGYIK